MLFIGIFNRYCNLLILLGKYYVTNILLFCVLEGTIYSSSPFIPLPPYNSRYLQVETAHCFPVCLSVCLSVSLGVLGDLYGEVCVLEMLPILCISYVYPHTFIHTFIHTRTYIHMKACSLTPYIYVHTYTHMNLSPSLLIYIHIHMKLSRCS